MATTPRLSSSVSIRLISLLMLLHVVDIEAQRPAEAHTTAFLCSDTKISDAYAIDLRSMPDHLHAALYGGDFSRRHQVPDSPGTFVKVSGAVAYLYQCAKVEVQLRTPTTCTRDVPVTFQNESLCMLPITRTLLAQCVAVPCTSVTPRIFEASPGKWLQYGLGFKQVPAPKPFPLDSSSLLDLAFVPVRDHSQAGIYTEAEVQAFQRAMAYPDVFEQVLERTVSGAIDENVHDGPISNDSPTAFERFHGFIDRFGELASILVGTIWSIALVRILVNHFEHGDSLRQLVGELKAAVTAPFPLLPGDRIHSDQAATAERMGPTSTAHDAIAADPEPTSSGAELNGEEQLLSERSTQQSVLVPGDSETSS